MANYFIFPPLGSPSAAWTIVFDFIFFLGATALVAWYYYYYLRKDLLGKFWGAMLVSAIGALIVFAIFQNPIREIVMWLMSPKLGSTQLSNVNLIAIFLGGFVALYFMNRINHNKERRD